MSILEQDTKKSVKQMGYTEKLYVTELTHIAKEENGDEKKKWHAF